MEKIRWPLGEPPIKAYQHHAFRLSIMQSHPAFYDWYYCQYIQLMFVGHRMNGMPILDFYEFDKMNPLIREMYVTKSTLTRYESIIPIFIDLLRDGHYVITFVNEFYIPGRTEYQLRHNVHDILIHGYDADEDVFQVVGFDVNRKYVTVDVKSELMEKALTDIGHKDSGNSDLLKWSDGIHLLRVEQDQTFTFDVSMITDWIEDYLNSRNSSLRFRMYKEPLDFTFGISVYDEMAVHVERTSVPDIRAFHVLMEHKVCMFNRMAYLREHKQIPISETWSDQCRALADQCLKLRNICLKGELKGTDRWKLSALDMLSSIREKDAVMLEGLYAELTSASKLVV